MRRRHTRRWHAIPWHWAWTAVHMPTTHARWRVHTRRRAHSWWRKHWGGILSSRKSLRAISHGLAVDPRHPNASRHRAARTEVKNSVVVHIFIGLLLLLTPLFDQRLVVLRAVHILNRFYCIWYDNALVRYNWHHLKIGRSPYQLYRWVVPRRWGDWDRLLHHIILWVLPTLIRLMIWWHTTVLRCVHAWLRIHCWGWVLVAILRLLIR